VAEPQYEIWTYQGARYVASERKLYHQYLDQKGKERWYAKSVGGNTVGYQYELPVTRNGESVSVVLNRAHYRGCHPNPDEVREWTVRDAADRALYDTVKLDKGKKNGLRDMTLEEIHGQIKKLPTPQRRALLATVVDILER
jgi:hypothetical protein